ARAGLGRPAEGIAEVRAGLAEWHGIGAKLEDVRWLGFLAEAHAIAAQVEEALVALDGATETMALTGQRYFEARLCRLRGEVLPVRSGAAEGEPWLRKAVECAQTQGARSLELRAATSLARLWRDQGKRTEARDLLAPIYDWFTEGFDTPD